MRPRAVLVLLLAAACSKPPELTDIGPRLISNQTSQPLALVGKNFRDGMMLELGAPISRNHPVHTVDATHAYVRLPADMVLPAGTDAQAVSVALVGAKQATQPLRLRVVNDAAFPDLIAMVVGDGAVFAASGTTDTIYRYDVASGAVTTLPGGDGPSALAVYTEADGKQKLLVAHQFEPKVWVCDGATGQKLTDIDAPAYASAIAVDGDSIVVAEQAMDTVRKIGRQDGKQVWLTSVDANPKGLTVTGSSIVVGSLLTGRVERLDRDSGKLTSTITPDTNTRIVGGHTEPFGKYIMGGKAQRDLIWLAKADKVLSANIGPNIGPNPEKMEVSMNGGVSVVDLASDRVTSHLGFGYGVPQALAVDEEAGRVYVADVATGLVRVVELAKLLTGDKAAVSSLPVPPRKDFPLTRVAADFSVNQRSGVELHSGPQALALSPDKHTLYVLNRFSGTLAVIDVTKAPQTLVTKQVPLVNTLNQREKRLGQILYFTDLGRTGMSCDACHVEGHGDSVLFEKTTPLRIYRVPTIRGTAETPPYFVPASTFSIAETNRKVGDRNRFQNPNQTNDEVTWLTIFASELATLPNPFVGPNGAPPNELTLPDGAKGSPLRGLELFEGKAECASCHPAPYFTTDQVAATRNRFIEVGTPHRMPLREELQSEYFTGFSIPALIGAWDVWPMLNTGLGGFDVAADKSGLEVRDRFALRAVIERYSKPPHGKADTLTPSEINDLLAYVMTL